jgi:hypothetical protein
MFAGDRVKDLLIRHLNETGNVMNLESNAHTSYDNQNGGLRHRVMSMEMCESAI